MVPQERPILAFTEEQWQELQTYVIKSTSLNNQEQELLSQSLVAKILGAIPYLAGCDNPDQLAVLEVSLYIVAMRNKELFSHREKQTIRERINTGFLSPLREGDPNIVDFGLTLLELISLNDHKSDLTSDLLNEHSNPLTDGNILYFPSKQILIKKLESFDSKIYQSFQNLIPGDVTAASWW